MQSLNTNHGPEDLKEKLLQMSSSQYRLLNTTIVEYDYTDTEGNQGESEGIEEKISEGNKYNDEVDKDEEENQEETEENETEVKEETTSIKTNSSSFGEYGEGVILSEDEKKMEKVAISAGWKANAFNEYVSNMISLDRSLPDARHPKCIDQGELYNPL